MVDRQSVDGTRGISQEHGARLIELDSERSQARNHGASHSTGGYLLFLDSDMVLEPNVVREGVALCERGLEAVIIPELSRGEGFWASCRSLEKLCYLGDRDMEAARFFRRDAFLAEGGFAEDLVSGEDWDLTQRFLSSGRTVGRTVSCAYHEEGKLLLADTFRKKYYYGKTLRRYWRKHPELARRQLSPFRRAFLRNRRFLAKSPRRLIGLMCLKSVEFAGGGLGYLAGLLNEPPRVSGIEHGLTREDRTKPLRVMIVGNYGGGNLGDELILKGMLLESVLSYGLGFRLVIPTRNPRSLETYHKEFLPQIEPVEVTSIRDAPRIIEHLAVVDKVVIGGGGLWSAYSGRFSGPLAHYIPIFAILARVVGKPVRFNGIGVYGSASSLDLLLTRAACWLSGSVVVRDSESASIIGGRTEVREDLGWRALKIIEATPSIRHQYRNDLAQYGDYQKLLEWKSTPGSNVLAISVRELKEPMQNARLLDALSRGLRRLRPVLEQNRVMVLFMPFSQTRGSAIPEDDRVPIEKIISLAGLDPAGCLVLEHTNPVLWHFAVKDFVDIMVCMRYHSQVLALESRIPNLTIPYDSKNRGLTRDDVVEIVEPEEITEDHIVRFVTRSLEKIKMTHDAELARES